MTHPLAKNEFGELSETCTWQSFLVEVCQYVTSVLFYSIGTRCSGRSIHMIWQLPYTLPLPPIQRVRFVCVCCCNKEYFFEVFLRWERVASETLQITTSVFSH
ncbi:hypothetical protein CEXT_460031 [Caerostris extrusa]|uniref:Uncharacterized protein n=1 Tax=Caerostris extrusa TaxID=172846 RepID=A0AAV4V006_CAEEX|nr:hypothetical protein CEXT_460031 [Caerostris extrusa]